MFMTKEADNSTSHTVIGESIKIEGTFSGSGDVTVKGEIVGSLKTSHNVVVEATAKIEADVEARDISVAGEIKGNVVCHGQLTVQATAKIFGDITTDIISVETGAVLKGQCTTGTGSNAAGTTTEHVR